MIKTHKTASSTLAAILNRLVDWRGLRKMVPGPGDKLSGPHFLGWPGDFPGLHQPLPSHQFDVIDNHAVLAHKEMQAFMRADSFFFSILRKPASRLVSAFNYFPVSTHPNQAATWDEMVRALEALRKKPCRKKSCAHFRNSMAHDLGWYRATNYSTKHDSDPSRIAAWVAELEQTLDLVMLVERLDEGLLLLRELLGLALVEIVYLPIKTSTEEHSEATPQFPTPQQERELQSGLQVDTALYDHFSTRFDSQWLAALAARPSLEADLDTLRCLNARLAEDCACQQPEMQAGCASDSLVGIGGSLAHSGCSRALLTDSVEYTKKLRVQSGFAQKLGQHADTRERHAKVPSERVRARARTTLNLGVQ